MGIGEVVTEGVGVERDGYRVNRVGIVAKEIGGKLSGAGEGEPHPALDRVDKGREVSSMIEEERDEVVDTVVAS